MLLDGYLHQGEVTEKARLQNAAREKDLWDSKLKQQKFLEIDGDLWRTELVIRVLAEVFKKFRESVVVFSDQMEHEADLPPEQVARAKKFSDGLLADVRERLINLDTGDDDAVGSEVTADSPRDIADDLADLGLD